jgi:SsrA-binding protein
MNRKELNKLEKQNREKGLTIVPLRVFINERGLAKMEIALARGKKQYDKREAIKQKDLKRDMERLIGRKRS